jgi:phosphate transport system permease protein
MAHSETAHDWSSADAKRRVRRRYSADARLQLYGVAAIGIALGLLLMLFASLVHAGYLAFATTKVSLQVFVDPTVVDKTKPGAANYRALVYGAFQKLFPDVTAPREKRQLNRILSTGAPFVLRDYIVANPDKIGQTVEIKVAVSDPFDNLHKGIIPRQIDALSPDRVEMFERLQRLGVLATEDGKGWIWVDAYIDPEKISADRIPEGNFDDIVDGALQSYFIDYPAAAYKELIDTQAVDTLRNFIASDPAQIGNRVRIKLPLAQNFANLLLTGQAKMRNPRFASDDEFKWYDSLEQRGLITTPFTWELFTNADSRFPEQAGLAGALVGSFLTLLVCFVLSFPIGIATAVYLEEFAPKNRLTDLIEVNINNLAAVPSVVFGLLGLALFLNTFGLPRSAPLVGGMVLALMTLPTIIVATRAALKAVPPSIREAALGVGASKHQVMFHHVLPLAMPGILTGTIIGLAQALGETAPLLLIGMNAFIPSIENMGLLQPAMALPTQIFSWADSPERGFVARTSAAILVLLGFLVVMNIIAVYLRQRLERKW